eukprot:2927158-Pleurochrysis_carterae.AAC.1
MARTLSCLGLLGLSLVSACSDSHLSRLARALTCLGLLGLSLVSACAGSHLSRLARLHVQLRPTQRCSSSGSLSASLPPSCPRSHPSAPARTSVPPRL